MGKEDIDTNIRLTLKLFWNLFKLFASSTVQLDGHAVMARDIFPFSQ